MRGPGLSGAENRDLEEISAAARHHLRRSDGWHKRRGEMRWWSGRQTGAPLHHVLPRETEAAATERDSAGRGCGGARVGMRGTACRRAGMLQRGAAQSGAETEKEDFSDL
jgi:hypothetical protein